MVRPLEERAQGRGPAQPRVQENSFLPCVCTGTGRDLVKNVALGQNRWPQKLYFEKLPKWFLISQQGPRLHMNIWDSKN